MPALTFNVPVRTTSLAGESQSLPLQYARRAADGALDAPLSQNRPTNRRAHVPDLQQMHRRMRVPVHMACAIGLSHRNGVSTNVKAGTASERVPLLLWDVARAENPCIDMLLAEEGRSDRPFHDDAVKVGAAGSTSGQAGNDRRPDRRREPASAQATRNVFGRRKSNIDGQYVS